jgi:hypothetical protein
MASFISSSELLDVIVDAAEDAPYSPLNTERRSSNITSSVKFASTTAIPSEPRAEADDRVKARRSA